jgi:integrase/recombinase XerD
MENIEKPNLIIRYTLSETITAFKIERGNAKKWTLKTEADFDMHFRLFKETAPKYLDEITSEIMGLHFKKLGEGRHGKPTPYMPVSSKRILDAFFNWCVKKEKIKKNPIDFDLGEPPQRVRDHIEYDDLHLFIAACDDSILGIRNRALLMLFANTGCRLSELLADPSNERTGIRDYDIDWKSRTVKVFGKGQRERIVGMQLNTAKYLLDYKDALRKQFPVKKTVAFFLTRDGQPLEGSGFRESFKRLCKILDKPFVPHDFRRRFCTEVNQMSVPTIAGMTLTGHKTEQQYHKYSKNYDPKFALAALEKNSPVAGL